MTGEQFLFGGLVRFCGAEGGDLNNFIGEVEMGEPETPSDQAAVAEQPFNLAGGGVGDQVEVLGFPSEQQVAHAASHQIGGKALSFQAVERLDGVRA